MSSIENQILKAVKKLREDVRWIIICLSMLAFIVISNMIFVIFYPNITIAIIFGIIEFCLVFAFTIITLSLLFGLKITPILLKEREETYVKYIKMGENYAEMGDMVSAKKYFELGIDLATKKSDQKWMDYGINAWEKITEEEPQ